MPYRSFEHRCHWRQELIKQATSISPFLTVQPGNHAATAKSHVSPTPPRPGPGLTPFTPAPCRNEPLPRVSAADDMPATLTSTAGDFHLLQQNRASTQAAPGAQIGSDRHQA